MFPLVRLVFHSRTKRRLPHPGLILYACDKNGDFCFECIGLEMGKGESIGVPKLRSYIKCTRRELMQLHEESLRDPITYAKKFGSSAEGYGPDGKPLKYPSRESIFLEKP